MIAIGDRLPAATLTESTEFGEACPVRPAPIDAAEAARGKRIAIIGLPGAFTETCSARHLPGFLANLPQLREKGVDEVWCVATNDGWTMAAWGRELGAIGKIRMLGDGSAEFTRKLGLEVEIPTMGTRMRRCSLLVEDGVVKQLNVEEGRGLGVSSAETLLAQLG